MASDDEDTWGAVARAAALDSVLPKLPETTEEQPAPAAEVVDGDTLCTNCGEDPGEIDVGVDAAWCRVCAESICAELRTTLLGVLRCVRCSRPALDCACMGGPHGPAFCDCHDDAEPAEDDDAGGAGEEES